MTVTVFCYSSRWALSPLCNTGCTEAERQREKRFNKSHFKHTHHTHHLTANWKPDSQRVRGFGLLAQIWCIQVCWDYYCYYVRSMCGHAATNGCRCFSEWCLHEKIGRLAKEKKYHNLDDVMLKKCLQPSFRCVAKLTKFCKSKDPKKCILNL